MDEFVPLVVAAALVVQLVRFFKDLTAGAFRDALTIAIVWVAGIVVAFLLAASDFAGGIQVAGTALGSLNAASVVLFGVSLGSAGSVVLVEFRKAIDGSQSSAEPKLGGTSTPPE